MSKSVPIAQAKDQLSRLVHDAEEGGSVELTRRGKPVAMIISLVEYRRLAERKTDFWGQIDTFRQAHGLDKQEAEQENWLEGARVATAGRGFDW